MPSLLQSRTFRKVLMFNATDAQRLFQLRALTEHDPMFRTHGVHDAELIRAALAFTAHHLAAAPADLQMNLLDHIASERTVSFQVHALRMQEVLSQQGPRVRRSSKTKTRSSISP
jgi:hypothetical protein